MGLLEQAQASDAAEAESLARRAVATLDAATGADHPDAAHARVVLALVLEGRGAFDTAGERLSEALASLGLWMDEEAEVVWPMMLSALQAAAANDCARGRYDEGRARLERAARLAQTHTGPRSLGFAFVANDRGVLEKLAGCYAAARDHYSTCLDCLREQGEVPPASLWHNLAGLACMTGEHDEAEAHARRAISAREASLGEGETSLELGADWAGLGDAQVGLGQSDDAVASYREALRQYEASGHGDHPEVAYALHNLADAEAERERFGQAEALYAEAIARKRAMFGPVHHELAASLNNLAVLEARLGRRDEASETSRRAVAAAQASPATHPVRVGCEQLFAGLGD